MSELELNEEDMLEGVEVEEPNEEEAQEEQQEVAEVEAEEPEQEQEQGESQEEPTEDKPVDPFKGIKFDDVQQEYIKERITDPLIGKRKEIEEDNRYLRGLLKQHGIEETNKPPEVPNKPDPFDPDFDAKMEERDRIIAQRATWDQQQNSFNYQQQAQIQADLNQRNEKYYQNAAEAGLKQDALLNAGDKVLAAEVNPQTIDYIMRHQEGPKITMYLSQNPTALQTLSQMGPMQAVEVIATKIAPFVAGQQTQRDDPPEPTEQLKGGGAAKLSETEQEIADLGLEIE